MKKYLTVLTLALVLCYNAGAQALCFLQDGKSGVEVIRTEDQLQFNLKQLKGKKWKPAKLSSTFYIEPDSEFILSGFMEYKNPYVTFDYLQRDSAGLTYGVASVDMQTGNISGLSFYGKNLKAPELFPEDYIIEGMSDRDLNSSLDEPVFQYLDSLLQLNPRLLELSVADYKTDKSVQWWLENNTARSRTLDIVQLDPECSLVSAYKGASHQKSDKYSVALVQVRGYNEFVSYRDGAYSLVWVEDIPADKTKDPYVKSYYMADSNTLAIIYYKGKTMFKRKINLANHSHSVK